MSKEMTALSRRAGVGMLLVFALALQTQLSSGIEREWQVRRTPGPVPTANWLRLASLGESRSVATALALYIQSFDAQAGTVLPVRELNLEAIRNYLERASELAPEAAYPLFLASRIYATSASDHESRQFLNWVEQRFPIAPRKHWPWLAHAVHVAQHRLKDTRLAQQYANTLRLHGQHAEIPAWARDLEFFLLAKLNEYEAAQALLGGLIASGTIRDEKALAVMLRDLESIKERKGLNGPNQRHRRSQRPVSAADIPKAD